MQHPDEGMIHSWLDGALSAEEAARVESHVGECASCRAAVAEARGFIAASSRILTALDDVPRSVLPAVPAKKRDIHVVWRAAAAMLVIAGGSLVVMREGGQDARIGTSSEAVTFATGAGATGGAQAPSPATDAAKSMSEARPLARADAATTRTAPTAPPLAPERRVESMRQRDLTAQSGIKQAKEPVRGIVGGTGAAAMMTAPSAQVQANRATPESDTAPLKVVSVETTAGSRRTTYEIAPSQTVILTQSESILLSQIVVTGAELAGAAAGAPRRMAEQPARGAATMSAEAAKSTSPPAPPVRDSRAAADSAARNERAVTAKTSAILQGQASAAFTVSPNTISWTEPQTGKTLTLSGRVSVERLQEIRKRIEKERAPSRGKNP